MFLRRCGRVTSLSSRCNVFQRGCALVCGSVYVYVYVYGGGIRICTRVSVPREGEQPYKNALTDTGNVCPSEMPACVYGATRRVHRRVPSEKAVRAEGRLDRGNLSRMNLRQTAVYIVSKSASLRATFFPA